MPTATTTSPRSTMAGKMKVECARSSITLTGRPTAFARADIAVPISPAPAHRIAITPREIGRQRIALRKLDPRHIRGVEPAYIVMAVGGIPANARARRQQQAQFRPRQVAARHQQHWTGLQIEKYRQESHAILASPTCGVDWNYFLYMSRSTPAKRKLFLLYCSATIEFSPPKTKRQRCIFSSNQPAEFRGCAGHRKTRRRAACKLSTQDKP